MLIVSGENVGELMLEYHFFQASYLANFGYPIEVSVQFIFYLFRFIVRLF